ncbi:double zinc ribbon domain-containing protein [Aggregatilinea lenta]|uniref:double zinc ribbon domain-containing protein n=1 Tax=Aggregatilinea lenta TaxID=913108 RepID=UPI000E5BE1C6|nr:zinc ribbon domain-containing protein [Aggregatilinea lenta]
MFDQDSLNTILLVAITVTGAVATAIWLGLIIWTWRDMHRRSRDPLAQIASTLLVAVLGVFGLIVYILLRPSETLAEAYERSLEEEALLQNIEEKPICPGCGRPVHTDWQVCPYCHTKLRKPCVNCGQLLELPWNLCPYCATPQIAPGEARSTARRQAVVAPPPDYDTVPEGDSPVEFVDDDAF